jgi:DNA-binding NarL/FixJ family response regulator
MQVSVSLVEGNHALRATFAALLQAAPGLRCLGAYRTAEEAVRRIPLEPPEIALVDMDLPGQGGVECVARLKDRLPDLRILMLTMYRQDDLTLHSLRAGAAGCLPKNTPAAELLLAVEQLQAGAAQMTMSIARKVMDFFQELPRPAGPREYLSPRERQILELLATGNQDLEIGETLGLSQFTVRTHLHAIYGKLHAQARAQQAGHFPARA